MERKNFEIEELKKVVVTLKLANHSTVTKMDLVHYIAGFNGDVTMEELKIIDVMQDKGIIM